MASLSDLRKIIREELRTVMREELREILVEAVQIASTPEEVIQESEEQYTGRMPSRQAVREQIRASVTNPMEELLQETRAGMTGADFYGDEVVPSAATEELPAFATRAAAIYEASKKVRPGGINGI